MAVLDEDFCTDLTTTEGGDTLWSLLRHRGILSPLAISVGQMLPSAYEKASASRMSLFRCSIALPARAPVNA